MSRNDQPIDDSQPESSGEFLEQMQAVAAWAGAQISGGIAFEKFSKELAKALPKLLPMVTEMAPDKAGRKLVSDEIAGLLATSIWNVTPQPGLNFRITPVEHGAGRNPCLCGSGKPLAQCCLGELTDSLVITGDFMLAQVLRDWPRARIGELPLPQLSPVGLAMTAYHWADAGRIDDAIALLAPLFGAAADLDARHVPALNVLVELYAQSGQQVQKDQLLRQTSTATDPVLRSSLFQREASILADRGEWPQAWEKFNAAADLTPASVTLAALEMSLLACEGRGDEIEARIEAWAKRWEGDPDLELNLEMLESTLAFHGQFIDPALDEEAEDDFILVPPSKGKPKRTGKSKRPANRERWQIKIAVDNVKPKVWRRVVVNDNLSFGELHTLIQRTIGWEDAHLHQFECDGRIIGPASAMDDPFGDMPMEEEQRVFLGELPKTLKKIRYWYDFGDDWWHTLSIEKRLPVNPSAAPAELLAGKNACPPEDCGGPWGYAELQAQLANPEQADDPELLEYFGDFDPAEFDLEEAQAGIAGLARRIG